MTVYVEYVLINNFIIDYLVLKATFVLTGLTPTRRRLFLCAAFGSVIALVIPLVSEVVFISTAIKILSGFLLTALCCKYPSVRSYFINTAVFFSYTFLTGGVIIGVFNILGQNYSAEIWIVFMAVPVYFLLKIFGSVINYIYRRKDVVAMLYKTEITVGGKTVVCKGFLDTGNGLYDGNNPVVVCGKAFAKELIGEDFYKVKLKKIYASTVNGNSENVAFCIDEIKIYISDEPNIFNNVTIMVVKESVGDGYDIILHPALLKESSDEKRDFKVKKVS